MPTLTERLRMQFAKRVALPDVVSTSVPTGTGFRHVTSGAEDAAAVALGTASTIDIDTDGTLAANSDAKIPTQKAVKTYVNLAVTGLLDFKGAQDCSANPNYPAASKGDSYVVSVAGKIGGASGVNVAIGDVFAAQADNAGGTQASVGTSWFVLEHNIPDLATVATTGSASDLAAGTLADARMPALTGDVTSSAGAVATTLANTAVTPATYGDSTHVGQFTVDSKGRITAASNVAVSGGGGSSDGLSTLVNSVNAITGAATAALNTLNKCTGTSADYPVTLPTAVGNGGKIIDIRGGTLTELTKVIAVTPATGEKIDDRAANAILTVLATEYVRFYSDNVQWWTVFHRYMGWQSTTNTVTGITSNPTKGTIVSDVFRYRRVGQDLQWAIDYEHSTGGAAGSGSYLWLIPYAVNTTLARLWSSATTVPNAAHGSGYFSDMATFSGYCSVATYDSTHFRLLDSTVGFLGSTRLPFSSTKVAIAAFGSVPIANW